MYWYGSKKIWERGKVRIALLCSRNRHIDNFFFFFLRIVFDRAWTPLENRWKELDPSFVNNEEDEFFQTVKKEW